MRARHLTLGQREPTRFERLVNERREAFDGEDCRLLRVFQEIGISTPSNFAEQFKAESGSLPYSGI